VITVTFYVNNSAKSENEITPQSNYVVIFNEGGCFWEPRFDLSVTQCRVDVTWFPFDEQTCSLVFKSWMLPESTLKLNKNSWPVFMNSSMESDGWYLLGMCRRYKMFL